MAQKSPAVLRVVTAHVWTLVCVGGTASCGWLGYALLRGDAWPGAEGPFGRLVLSAAAVLGGLAGLYGIAGSTVLAARGRSLRRARSALRALKERSSYLEARYALQRERLDELATLREIATIVNQESDLSIIAEKGMELVSAVMEPLEITMFLHAARDKGLVPFAQYTHGKMRTGRKVTTRSIPDFDVSAFESHSMVCRMRGRELQAIVPLRVEDETHGALFLAFATDDRTPQEQTEGFYDRHRTFLLEIAHHLSLAVKTKYLHTKAVVDNLTQLYTRSHFDTQLQAAIEMARRTGEPFALILADIDHFKAVNDTYGHSTGDVVLKRLAGRIKAVLRKYDTAYRYGGEELAVILPRSRLREAILIAERLRREIEGRKFRGADNKLIQVTVSLGVAQFQGRDGPESLFNRADRHLYTAKHKGRNRVMPAT